jgi:hypothetical protein
LSELIGTVVVLIGVVTYMWNVPLKMTPEEALLWSVIAGVIGGLMCNAGAGVRRCSVL